MQVYLDNNATTRTAPEVVEAMRPYYTDNYGNASSFHQFGQAAKQGLDEARGTIAEFLGVNPDELVFTGSGTEADNYVLRGVAARYDDGHLITSAIEHPAVLQTCRFLAKGAFELTVLPVDGQGRVDPDELRRALRPDTRLVSIMAANNEIGTLQDLAALGRVCREAEVPFHSDSVQALGKIELNLAELPLDFAAASAHKLHGPKGVGLTYIRRGQRAPVSLLLGGGHEKRRRASTENVAGAVGFARAVELAAAADDHRRIGELRDRLEEGLTSAVSETTVLAAGAQRLPNTSNIIFAGVEGESIVMGLDFAGIAVSTGSACSSGSLEPSHVILALGYDHGLAQGTIRFSLSRYTTAEEIDYTIKNVPPVIERLRNISAF